MRLAEQSPVAVLACKLALSGSSDGALALTAPPARTPLTHTQVRAASTINAHMGHRSRERIRRLEIATEIRHDGSVSLEFGTTW